MNGIKQLATVAIDREALYHAAVNLAKELRQEIPRLDRDAVALQERLPRFAADVRTLRRQLTTVLKLAEAVLAAGRGTT